MKTIKDLEKEQNPTLALLDCINQMSQHCGYEDKLWLSVMSQNFEMMMANNEALAKRNNEQCVQNPVFATVFKECLANMPEVMANDEQSLDQ